jgi:hypothetical protein
MLRVGSEAVPIEAEDLVAHLEHADVRSDRIDVAGHHHAECRRPLAP